MRDAGIFPHGARNQQRPAFTTRTPDGQIPSIRKGSRKSVPKLRGRLSLREKRNSGDGREEFGGESAFQAFEPARHGGVGAAPELAAKLGGSSGEGVGGFC